MAAAGRADPLRRELGATQLIEIIRAIRNSPASYGRIEEFLLQEAPFEHFREDSVAVLDETAQTLFSQSLE